jgi:hypothetical protein
MTVRVTAALVVDSVIASPRLGEAEGEGSNARGA